MRVPHFMAGYVSLDDSLTIVDLNGEPMGEMLNPALLTFPMLGEFLQPLDEVEDFTPRPIKCSISKALEWLYRVKKWSAQIEIPSGPGSEFGAVSFDLESGISDELNLLENICEPNYIKLTFYGESSVPDDGDRSFSANATLDLFIRVQAGDVPNHSEQEFRPYQVATCTDVDTDQIIVTMRLRTGVTIYDNVTFEEWQGVTDSWDDQLWDEYTDSTVVLDTEAFYTRWPWIGFTSGGITYLESAPQLTISPAEWWPYSDGVNPIWSATTGAQLRSVITGETI